MGRIKEARGSKAAGSARLLEISAGGIGGSIAVVIGLVWAFDGDAEVIGLLL